MSKQINRHRRVGMTVMLLLMLALTVAVSVRLYNSEALVLRTRLSGVAGLRVGADVLMSGFSVGRVIAIQPLDMTVRAFEVTIRLDQAWQVPDDSTVTLHQSNPIDVVRLNIVPGQSPGWFKSGDRIAAAAPAPGLLDTVSQLAPRVTALLDKIGEAADQAAAAAASVNRVLGFPATAAQPGAEPATVGRVLADTHATLTATTGAVTTVNDETRKTLLAVRTSLEQLQTIGRHGDSLMVQLSALTADSAGDLRRMVHDSEFVLHGLARAINPLLEDLQALTANLNDLAQQMRDNPSAVIFGRPPHDEPGQHKPKP
ncbi:MAG: MlaD family protein [Rhodospirillaceae bacterium]